jgi:hypothetical protein
MTPESNTFAGSRLIDFLLLLWIAGTALFYFLRFSATFYYANADAIRSLAW